MIIPLLFDTLSCLRELYVATGGANWSYSNGWDGDDFCKFQGITCYDDE